MDTFAQTDWSLVITVALVVIGLGVGVPIVRRSSTKPTIELLRTEVQVEREARLAQEQRCTEEIAREREQRAREVGELRGQVQAMTPQFAGKIGDAVIEHLKANGLGHEQRGAGGPRRV